MTTPYSEGRKEATLLFVGEAPARWEMVKGRPLVGESGKIFDASLHRAGVIRGDVRIENVVRKPIGSITDYISSKGVLTEKGNEAVQDLRERIAGSGAKVIVPLGNLALKAVANEYRITKVRGSPMHSTILDGPVVIPSIHPASTLPGRGKYIDRYTIASDFQKAARFAVDGFRPIERKFDIFPDLPKITRYLKGLQIHNGPIAFDIEIYNFQVSCIGFSTDPAHAICIPFVGEKWSIEEEIYIWKLIQTVMGDPTITLVAHNAMFDISFLFLQNNIRTRARVHDTLIMHRVLYPDFPSRLDFVTSNYTDEPYYKDDKQIWKTPERDEAKFYRYNCKDAATTMEIFYPLMKEIMADVDMRWTYENTMSLFEPCLYMMARGVLLNLEKLDTLKAKVRIDLDKVEKELEEVCKYPLNYNSPKQMIEHFYIRRGVKPYINRKTSKPTCDDKALTRIVRKYNLPEARLCQRARGLKKLLSTYLELEYDKDNRLRCTYSIRGTTSGRLSSSKTIFETGLNMQNLDPRFKGFIIPG